VNRARRVDSARRTSRLALAVTLGCGALLSACSSIDLSGLSGPSAFKCKAPDGVSCMSVSGLYANASQGNLPAMKRTPADELLRLQGSEAAPGASASGWNQGNGTGQAGMAAMAFAAPAQAPRATTALSTQPASVPQPSTQQVPPGTQAGTGLASPANMEALSSGQPLRQGPKVLRVWVAPVEDAEGQLHDQRFIYAVVHQGRWAIEVNRANIQRQFRPVYQLGRRDDGERSAEGSGDAGAAQRGRQPSQRAVESVQRSGGTLPPGVSPRPEGD
jgi:conjugal transfer pilus assembly protein TraV